LFSQLLEYLDYDRRFDYHMKIQQMCDKNSTVLQFLVV
uniref:GCP_C_terminal domain-containing protein n=1 Tax=Haemonchus placei TaxID=6290 RepID=A0A0N4VZF6_HAEPC